MKLELYQIDVFTDKTFGGNPACVVPLAEWLPDDLLLKITKENAVSETAFFVYQDDKIHNNSNSIYLYQYGHATLASAYCLKKILNYPHNKIVFKTLSGDLTVLVENDLYCLDFPSRMPVVYKLPEIIKRSLNIQPNEVYKSRDYLLVYNTEQEIENIKINRQLFDQINLDPGGVIVTSKGDNCDFVSRFFTPQASIMEDPVTGSAHCSLIPFWSFRLGKDKLNATQISDRGGKLLCQNKGDRVIISGKAKTYSIGSLWTE